MGHNKNQRTATLKDHAAEVRRLGVSLEVWSALSTKHFSSVAMNEMDSAVRKFHAALRSL